MTGHAPSHRPPRLLRALGKNALETALNRVVALDPDLQGDLASLDGKRLDIDLRGPDLVISLQVAGDRIKVDTADLDTSASLRVSATPGNFIGMLLPGDRDTTPPGRIEVAGDAELARRLEKLARNYAPDLEAAFAQICGDVAGVPLARMLQRTLSHLRDSLAHAVDDGADWLREEARLGVASGEMDDFLDGVDALRQRTDHLDARLAQLAQRKARHP